MCLWKLKGGEAVINLLQISRFYAALVTLFWPH